MITLEAARRDTTTKPEKLRKEGKIPAVFYGRKEYSTPVVLDAAEFLKAWNEAGESSLVTLVLPDRSISVLIHDVSVNPVTEAPTHVDLYATEADRAVEVSIPVEFTGEAPSVKMQEGTLVKVLHEITVEGLPSNLPHKITIDISGLENLDSRILVRDIKVPDGISVKEDADDVVAAISVAVGEEEAAETTEEFDASAVAVEEKGKKEEESEQ